MPRIIDTFPFWKELDLLELRLAEIGDLVDRIVLVESIFNWRSRPKPLYFADNFERFTPWLDKIEHVVVDHLGPMLPGWNQNWSHEIYQRNQIMRGLADAADDNIVLICDVDEIPSREILRTLRGEARPDLAPIVRSVIPEHPFYLKTRLHYYYLDCVSTQPNEWYRANACSVGWLRRTTPQAARIEAFQQYPRYELNDAGWHFSYLGNAQFIADKLGDLTHDEFDLPHLRDTVAIEWRRANGVDPLSRMEWPCKFIPFDESFPESVKADPQKYARLGWFRNPPTT